jgi:hypothetical protein
MFQIYKGDNEDRIPKQVEVKKEDINSKLPYTVQVEEYDRRPETIAYRIWFDFLKRLESEGVIANPTFTRFSKLSGDDNLFVAAVVFQVQIPEGTQEIDYEWGKMQDNRVVSDIVWKLTIKRSENLTYTLTNIERSTDTLIGLPPVETLDEYRKNAGLRNLPKMSVMKLKMRN